LFGSTRKRDETTVQLVGFNPDHSAFNLPEVNQQLDKLKLPNTVLFDRSRAITQKQALKLPKKKP